MRNLLTTSPHRVGHARTSPWAPAPPPCCFDPPATSRGGHPRAPRQPRHRHAGAGNVDQAVDAIVLSGGSVFGSTPPAACSGVARPGSRPLDPRRAGADRAAGDHLRSAERRRQDWNLFSPYRDLGHAAAQAASDGNFALGSVGAGTGATTATVKGGLGSASAMSRSGHMVAAIAVVNAVGSAHRRRPAFLVGPL